MTPAEWIPLLAVLVAVAGIFFTQKNFSETMQKEIQKNSENIASRISILETKVEVVWKGVAFDLAQVLHQPHPEYAERDDLLEKLLSDEISSTELLRLRDILKNTVGSIHDEGNYGERVAASMLMRIIESTLISEPNTPLTGTR